MFRIIGDLAFGWVLPVLETPNTDRGARHQPTRPAALKIRWRPGQKLAPAPEDGEEPGE